MRPARSAFTLVETLACFAVVAVLTGLLIPALRGVRATAREVQCVAALHSYAQAVHAYAADAHDMPPAAPVVVPDHQFVWSGPSPTVRFHHAQGGFSQVHYPRQGWFSIYLLARESYVPFEASYCPGQRSIADPTGPGRYDHHSLPNLSIPEVFYFRPAVYSEGPRWPDEASALNVQPLFRVRHPADKVLVFERSVWHLPDQPTLHAALRTGRAASLAAADGSALAYKSATAPPTVRNRLLGYAYPSPWVTQEGVFGRDLN